MTDSDLEQRIEDLMVMDLGSVMSKIEYGDPLPELTTAIWSEIDKLNQGHRRRASDRPHQSV